MDSKTCHYSMQATRRLIMEDEEEEEASSQRSIDEGEEEEGEEEEAEEGEDEGEDEDEDEEEEEATLISDTDDASFSDGSVDQGGQRSMGEREGGDALRSRRDDEDSDGEGKKVSKGGGVTRADFLLRTTGKASILPGEKLKAPELLPTEFPDKCVASGWGSVMHVCHAMALQRSNAHATGIAHGHLSDSMSMRDFFLTGQ